MAANRAMERTGRRGFSLVELVIVIVIIGIIAAIAIPRVSRGSRGAGESALASNLAVLRNAIELYASEHDGVFPGAEAAGGAFGSAGTEDAFIAQLTMYSNLAGAVSETRDAAGGFLYGPYLRKGIPPAPVGANRNSTEVKMDPAGPAVDAASEAGWVYNPTTGDIIVNSDAMNETGLRSYDEY